MIIWYVQKRSKLQYVLGSSVEKKTEKSNKKKLAEM